jgi:hypothetical protein
MNNKSLPVSDGYTFGIDECLVDEMTENRKLVSEEDLKLFQRLIDNRKFNNVNDENITEKLLWKDFLSSFKKRFKHTIGDVYAGKISIILRSLLKIDQYKHVRSGIKLSFEEWIEVKNES